MNLIREKINELAGTSPFVLLGDFNFEPHEAPYKTVEDWGIQDAFLKAEKKTAEKQCTFTGFQVEGAECKRIDYIFASQNLNVKNYSVLDDHEGGYFPSDHLPVIADLELR
jgi:endonuclease/exonuclease/phosphatase family metal-dependent hydrolase